MYPYHAARCGGTRARLGLTGDAELAGPPSHAPYHTPSRPAAPELMRLSNIGEASRYAG